MAIEALLARLAASTVDQPVALGRYQVIGRLGQGGMGTVYEAIDRERGTRVALKTLSEDDATAGQRLKREFRVVADLAHPNLAPVYELSCEDGLWFFAMERIAGQSFLRWARGPAAPERATRPLPLTKIESSTQNTTSVQPGDRSWSTGARASPPARELAQIRGALAELAAGLEAIHRAGLWHGDIKPENVLVRDNGHVAIVDFGLVEQVNAVRSARGPTAGTPIYMSSEQLSGQGAGPASDWYAVGTMLYEVLTGRLPFDADSLLDLYFCKTHQTPPSPRELLPETPADLSDLTMALLQAQPERRPGGQRVLEVMTGQAQPVLELPRTIFVGRKRELRVMEKAYGLARMGSPMVVHAHGPSGIGKSAMLASFARGVEDVDRAQVLRGRCYERENVPYKAFDGIVDQLATRLGDARLRWPESTGELLQVFPALGQVPALASRAGSVVSDPGLLRRRAWNALRDLLAAMAGERSLVITIDDLQWADADSARLLTTLIDEMGAQRLLVLVSYRPQEAAANPALAEYFAMAERLETTRQIVDIAVGPLPAAEAEQLARSVLHGSAANLRALTEEAHGVPFFIEELARYAASAGRLPGELSLDDAIRARVRALPAEQRSLIEMVCVAESPVPQSALFTAAGLEAQALPALLGLRSAQLVTWSGAGASDTVTAYHDRIRESVLASLDEPGLRRRHLALGRALQETRVFEALRHLAAAGLEDPAERLAAARLALDAGKKARQSAAFPLAFACFEHGLALGRDWEGAYDLTLALTSGAAEAAYLAAEWMAMEARCAELEAHGRSALDQLVAWEVTVDACVGRHEYLAALEAGRRALGLLGVQLSIDPAMDELQASVGATLEQLTRIGPDGLRAMPDASDPKVVAATRLMVRLAPAAYFGKPLVLPVIACNLIQLSIARGLSPATPYALAVFGIVLNTAGLYPVSHVWGTLAVNLIDRWPDRKLEAATRHVVFNLVCSWMVPLREILAPLREVWDIGRRIGDLEYASYAAHGWVHNCLYAGLPLRPLADEAATMTGQMRAMGQVNALHVHQPFEQLLESLLGRLPGAPCLDGPGFSEEAELAAHARDGSRSGIFILRLVMGLSRYLFGDEPGAAQQLAIAREYLDAAPSVWHQPILHQYAALAGVEVEKGLAELRTLASHCPANFAHRVALVEGEALRRAGDLEGARRKLEEALALATAGQWTPDVILAHELLARCGDREAHLTASRAVFDAWIS